MSQKLRRETSYFLNKGVNEKSSKYTINDTQVSSLFNLDFNIPNALTKREGSTNMVTANTSGPINCLFEFEKLGGASYLMAGTDTAMFNVSGGSFSPIATGYANGQPFDIVAFTDKAWFTNGETFLSWDGSGLLPYSMQSPPNTFNLTYWGPSNAITQQFGISTVNDQSYTIFAFRYSFTRSDGFEGPLQEEMGSVWVNVSGAGRSLLPFYTPTLAQFPTGASFLNIYMAINTSDVGFGGADLTAFGKFAASGASTSIAGSSLFAGIPASSFRRITSMGASMFSTNDSFNLAWDAFSFNVLVYDKPTAPEYQTSFVETFTPRYIEINQNRLFQAGFSAAPSDVFFSEIGEPERVNAESTFEVRTNDGDEITGMKSYRDELVVFKRYSFHKLLGDSADNYNLAELSTEYGCISNKAIAEYQNRLVFLDEKGIVEYNGANWDIISYPVEDTFRRMNINAAIQKAVAVHHQNRNQIWFGIPVDGSTVNNLTVVYDYLLNAWTFFDGFQPASMTEAKRELTIDRLWYGDYSGNISHFSPSFYADNGTGFTCLIKTKFDAPDGQNIQNNFRRFFLDLETASGVTGVVNVNVYADYNDSTIKATFPIYQDQFQTRKDFGVRGKSAAFQMSHNSASLPLTIYGYTVQRRFLRDV